MMTHKFRKLTQMKNNKAHSSRKWEHYIETKDNDNSWLDICTAMEFAVAYIPSRVSFPQTGNFALNTVLPFGIDGQIVIIKYFSYKIVC